MNVALAMIPDGLVRCDRCGKLRGRGPAPDPPDRVKGTPVTISCLCDGLVCGRCGVGRLHRPISDYYDERTGEVIHMPWFSTHRECGVCGGRDWVADYRHR